MMATSHRRRRAAALLPGMLAILLSASPAAAASLSKSQLRCQEGLAKAAAKFLSQRLKIELQCREANLASPGACIARYPSHLAGKLRTAIIRRCSSSDLAAIGFPGPCDDPDPSHGFTVDDLQTCLVTSHEAATMAVLRLPYDPTVVGPLDAPHAACLRRIGRDGTRFVNRLLPAIQKCRNGVLRDRITSVPRRGCATAHAPTAAVVAALEQKLRTSVTRQCPSDLLVGLGLCGDVHITIGDPTDCLVARLRALVDGPDVSQPPDLIDYEYAEPRVCGDHRRNRAAEECDGPDDEACPGQCGAPYGPFPCLCQNLPRQRVVEHADADLDLAFEHDSPMPPVGGYVVDLWDCDGPGGPDTVCTVGPSCSLPPHSACSPGNTDIGQTGDQICAALGEGTCRATAAGAMGPHCTLEPQRRCAHDGHCPIPGDRCVETLHGAPLPIVSGGVAVCVVNTFTEDVVGTTDLATGAGAVRLRHDSATFAGGDLHQPCPVCGGFCAGSPGVSGPGGRTRCASDAECAAGVACVVDTICSWGPNVDQPCRPNAPFGGPTEHFGNPSMDCLPDGNLLGTSNRLFNPRTTDTLTQQPTFPCRDSAFAGSACIGGPAAGRPCAGDSDCPNGSCNPQCFCDGQPAPNPCPPACVGGPDDGMPCSVDATCPGGFCHAADCRADPSDGDSVQEGHCTADPSRQCFVNTGIVREGAPGTAARVTAAIACLPATGSPAVDAVAGLPGPMALTQPETTLAVGF